MTTVINFISSTMMATTFTLVLMLLITTVAASALPSEPVTTAEKGVAGQHKKPVGNSLSSIDLYHSMELGEQERLESLGGNDDDEEDSEKDSGDSLLSMVSGGGGDDDDDDDDNDIDGTAVTSTDQENLTTLLTCVSCSGLLPKGNEQNANIDEQSYCFPDRGLPQSQNNGNGNNGVDEKLNVCSGAVRCWKAKVREEHGQVRISRGCTSSGHGGGNRHSAQSTAEHHFLDPCMRAISNDSRTKNSDSSKQSQYRVWTSSHTYTSAFDGLQQPTSYVIECCSGRDRCNDGPFPSLSVTGLPSMINDNDLTWWRWSSNSVETLMIIFVIVVTIAIVSSMVFAIYGDGWIRKKKRRKRRSKSKRNKRRKWSTRQEDGNSDDSDKKRHRHLSFSSMSSSSSSLSSVASSSCCEGKRVRRKQHTNALTMVDLLKGVVVTNEGINVNENTNGSSSKRPTYTAEYSPAAMTESTVDDDFLPPPYQRQKDHHRKDQPEDDWTSGSGYGMPVLVQRTLAKQIQLRQLVGKGRYGEVWRATYWNGGHEHVAVKIFLSKDEPSWKRETEIYSTVLMRHDNILGFIGSDIMTSRNSYTTQLLLITHYHRHGSLYDFLQTPAAAADTTCNGYDVGAIDAVGGGRPLQIDHDRPPLTVSQMLNVLYTVASGLCHLHTEIHGTQGKPGIAHRDIKSKNVLVKDAQTGACCIADFGMAVTSRDASLPIQTTTAAGANQNTRVGTKRYMAPEVLDDSIPCVAALSLASTSTAATVVSSVTSSSSSTAASVAAAVSSSSAYWCFTDYCRGDVYSYALVMWEVLSRTLLAPEVDDGKLQLQRPNIQQKPYTDNRYDPYVYRAPYQDRGVGWDPGFDDMRSIVCSTDPVQSRPGVAPEWLAHPIMNDVVKTMQQCWNRNRHARLPSLRIKKNLSKLIEQYSTTKTEL